MKSSLSEKSMYCRFYSLCSDWIPILISGPSVEDSISPQKDVQRAIEDAGVVLSCRYKSSLVNSLLWYRQYPASAPQFLIMEYSGYITNPIPGLNITHIKQQKLVELQITSAAVSDSALYYCALQPTVTGNTDSLYKNLLSITRSPSEPSTQTLRIKHISASRGHFPHTHQTS